MTRNEYLGFIGLGNVGIVLARDLVRSKHSVWIYDADPEKTKELASLGAHVADSAADVAKHADIIGVCVRRDEDVWDVLNGPDGILSAHRRDLLILIHSTVRLDTVMDIAKVANESGIAVVDAPVTRSAYLPSIKGLVFMVGGEPNDVSRARILLDLAAHKVVEAGPLGSGMTLKVCNNIFVYATMAAASDIITLMRQANIDISNLTETMVANGAASHTLTSLFERWSGTAFADHVVVPRIDDIVDLAEKDIDCALGLGQQQGVSLPFVTETRRAIRGAVNTVFGGFGDYG